jgi:hypothetical protein
MKRFDEINFQTRILTYIHNGIENSVTLRVYKDVNDHLSMKNPLFSWDLSQYYLEYLMSTTQRHYLNTLIEAIWERTKNIDDQVRIAVNLVQKIPYDMDKPRFEMKYNPNVKIRYPYEVIVDNKGVCCEKSLLLAFLLRELGFGVALFIFEKESHMAVGIKCPKEFSYYNTGYAFIETTGASIATDIQLYYKEINNLGIFWKQLTSSPRIIPLCDGSSFDSVYQELFDAKEWNELNEKYRFEGGYYDERRVRLIQKYGL